MKILYAVLKERENEWEKRKVRLEKEGWQIREPKERAELEAAGKDGKEPCLFLSDSGKLIKELENVFPVIYYEKPGASAVYGADLVILDLAILDGLTLERTWQRHYGIPWKIAETTELLIRESVETDFEELYAIYQEPETTRYIPPLSADKKKEKEIFHAYIRNQYAFYGYGLYSVVEKSQGNVIGRVGFENRDYEGKTYLELGYLISAPYRGRGLAFQASRAVLNHLEELTGEAKAVIFYHLENLPSARTAEKISRAFPGEICLMPFSFSLEKDKKISYNQT